MDENGRRGGAIKEKMNKRKKSKRNERIFSQEIKYTDCMYTHQYERLVAWKEAHALSLSIYRVTRYFPKEELFGLVSQMRRAATSISFNIAEGNIKKSKNEKVHFFTIAIGSLEELHAQLRLSKDLEYVAKDVANGIDAQMLRVGYLLHQLRTSILSDSKQKLQ